MSLRCPAPSHQVFLIISFHSYDSPCLLVKLFSLTWGSPGLGEAGNQKQGVWSSHWAAGAQKTHWPQPRFPGPGDHAEASSGGPGGPTTPRYRQSTPELTVRSGPGGALFPSVPGPASPPPRALAPAPLPICILAPASPLPGGRSFPSLVFGFLLIPLPFPAKDRPRNLIAQ